MKRNTFTSFVPLHLASALILPTLFGCSPAADPVAKGGAHFTITHSSVADAGNCGLTSIGGLGDTTPPELPSAGSYPRAWGERVADGKAIEGSDGNYVVKCTMGGSSSSRTISIEMSGPNTSLQRGDAVGLTGVYIDGTIKSDGTGEASVAVRTTKSGMAISSAPCTLSAVPEEGEPTDSPENFQVGEDHARFTFVCPYTDLNDDDFSDCETRGTIQVADCAKE